MDEMNKVMSELAAYTRMLEEIQGIVDGLKDTLKKYMESNGLEVLASTEHKATYKPYTCTRVDTTALKKAAPDVAEKFTKSTTTKRFTFD